MANEQAAVASKAGQKRAPRKRRAPTDGSADKKGAPSVKRSRKARGQPANNAAPFELEATTVSTFEIGGVAQDVVLSGSGLDSDGLEAVILVRQGNAYVDPNSNECLILIEQPASGDDIYPDEFPISVKVVKAPPGPYYFAVRRTIWLPGIPPTPLFQIDVLETPIWLA
jgi:hypothetical protein